MIMTNWKESMKKMTNEGLSEADQVTQYYEGWYVSDLDDDFGDEEYDRDLIRTEERFLSWEAGLHWEDIAYTLDGE